MTKHAIKMTTLSVIALLAVTTVIGLNNAFAEEEYPYKVADDVRTVFTFTFKDGVDVVDFPVFKMEDDFVKKNVSPSFAVEGVVGEAPYLHKALDEAFKYKASPSHEYNYQLFEVDIDFVKNGEIIRSLAYHDCYVDNYKVQTLTDDYESYLSSSSGFPIIDNIEFLCGGLNSLAHLTADKFPTKFTTVEYAHTTFKYADDVRTFVTFEFDQGIEKIEFPYFQTNEGFEESDDNVIPGFSVESTMKKHMLLDKAIERARSNSGIATGVNVDFEATVEFVQGDKVLRTLEYKDCRVSGALITTLYDKEEGFTGKSGFAYVEELDFECIGLDTVNTSYDLLRNGAPIWRTSFENTLVSHEYPLGNGPRAIATFTYDNGVETLDFPIFNQDEVLVKSNPTFELEGLVRDSTMLYKAVDENLALTSTTGANNFLDLFQVDVELVYGDKVVRGFNYVDCRVVDYDVKTQRDKEESYFKGFALSNSFTFTCQGYHPNAPPYDALFAYEKGKNISSLDLRNTQEWGPGFYKES